ncbi:MAG TPA: protein kinase, partial [Polyangium sp.]|nr:protein kinase [Polyangium sp.]
GDVKLLDFGVAKLLETTSTGTGLTSVNRQIGTLTIMAPEQLLCAPVDARTDVYALGALLYRVLTGRLPFESTWAGELVRKHLEDPAPRPSERAPLSREIDAVVLKCLEKRPERRYESVHALMRALRHAISAGTETPGTGTTRFAIGIYVEIQIRSDVEDDPDTLDAEIEHVLSMTEERLQTHAFVLCTCTSAEVLGVQILPPDSEKWLDQRHAALRVALDLHDELVHRQPNDARVHVNVSIHAGEISIQENGGNGDIEITGGPLCRTSDWASTEATQALCATWEMLDGLDDFEAAPGPDPLVLVSRRPRR